MGQDTQIVELSGRHFLIAQLLAGGVEVAEPIRDRGIDLIAYLDRDGDVPQFLGCPIQLKANQEARFGLDRKYAQTPSLLMVHIWDLSDAKRTAVYALTYAESLQLLEDRGHTQTPSWKEHGTYSLKVNASWRKSLQPFEMTPERWAERIRRTVARTTRY